MEIQFSNQIMQFHLHERHAEQKMKKVLSVLSLLVQKHFLSRDIFPCHRMMFCDFNNYPTYYLNFL